MQPCAVTGMDSWDLSMLEAARGVPVVWAWALRRPEGAGLLYAIGIMYSPVAAND
jgi:hypothetical protein